MTEGREGWRERGKRKGRERRGEEEQEKCQVWLPRKDENSGQKSQIHIKGSLHSSESREAQPTGGTRLQTELGFCSVQGLKKFPLKALYTDRKPLSGPGTGIPIHKAFPKDPTQNLSLMRLQQNRIPHSATASSPDELQASEELHTERSFMTATSPELLLEQLKTTTCLPTKKLGSRYKSILQHFPETCPAPSIS